MRLKLQQDDGHDLAPGLSSAASAFVARAGVSASYHLHDWILGNRASRRLLRAAPPKVDRRQRDAIEELRSDGLSLVKFRTLFPDKALWKDLSVEAATFARKTEHKIERDRARNRKEPGKRHLRRMYRYGTELPFSDPWLQIGASPRLLDIVNSYLGLYSKLIYVDLWYTVPMGAEEDRISSQRWHRDFTDKHLVKVFIYMTDVDEGAGPFEYVRGSAGSGPYAGLWRWRPGGTEMYPPADEFARRIPSEEVRTITGEAGTVIFCNTSGFHRGGFATDRPRIMAVYNYASTASLETLCKRNFRVDAATLPADAPPAVRFALT